MKRPDIIKMLTMSYFLFFQFHRLFDTDQLEESAEYFEHFLRFVPDFEEAHVYLIKIKRRLQQRVCICVYA